MNVIIGLVIALAVSIAGNALQANARAKLVETGIGLERDLRNSRALENQCSQSIEVLEQSAKAAKEANSKALAIANKSAQGKEAMGLKTLSTARSVPADECASVGNLLDDWYKQRAKP